MGKKKHHFIPRFYLKRFSINEEGKSIGLYNYKNNLFIKSAPIKYQACEDFLYGNDEIVEDELSKLESTIAKMFYFWTEEKILELPPKNSNGSVVLKRYMLYQLYRTPKAGNEILEHLNDAFQKILPFMEPQNYLQFEGLKIHNEKAALSALINSADKEYLLDYLECRFVVNLSDLPYITSDSPVVLYNQYLERYGRYEGATGLPVKGLQIFFPIHPRLMIFFYDPVVYKCGDTINCISTENINDIHQLNVMQFLNSSSQLYFDEEISQEYIEKCIIKEYQSHKVSSKRINEIIETQDNRRFLLSCTEDFHIGLELSFLEIISNKQNIEIAPLRHPSLVRK